MSHEIENVEMDLTLDLPTQCSNLSEKNQEASAFGNEFEVYIIISTLRMRLKNTYSLKKYFIKQILRMDSLKPTTTTPNNVSDPNSQSIVDRTIKETSSVREEDNHQSSDDLTDEFKRELDLKNQLTDALEIDQINNFEEELNQKQRDFERQLEEKKNNFMKKINQIKTDFINQLKKQSENSTQQFDNNIKCPNCGHVFCPYGSERNKTKDLL